MFLTAITSENQRCNGLKYSSALMASIFYSTLHSCGAKSQETSTERVLEVTVSVAAGLTIMH
jgi:shikimate kinase